jgi:hypothetical protein
VFICRFCALAGQAFASELCHDSTAVVLAGRHKLLAPDSPGASVPLLLQTSQILRIKLTRNDEFFSAIFCCW